MNNIKIKETLNYQIFNELHGNRNINKFHVERLKNSMSKKYLHTVISVNENYEVIDGQHRLQACKELNLPIKYVVLKGYGLKEVQTLNAMSSNWTTNQFLESYCSKGIINYLQYKKFKTHEQHFKKGSFKIENYEKACYYANQIIKIAPYYKGYNRRHFVRAMFHLLNNEDFNMNEFLQKLSYQSTSLVDCINRESYLMLIEEIYNYRRKMKINLRY